MGAKDFFERPRPFTQQHATRGSHRSREGRQGMTRKSVLMVILLSLFIQGYRGSLAHRPYAQEIPKGLSGITSKAQNKDKEIPKGKLSVTRHAININSKVLEYTATVGYMEIQNKSGEHEADIFFIAYAQNETVHPFERPITFVFNGGPGASSVWLHLGAAGPKRVEIPDQDGPLFPPYRLVNNEYGWLDLTDLVFIDPVGTGYSRPAPGKDLKEFYGVERDIETIGEFIRLYTTKFERWPSPKFIAGESYGTMRAVLLADYLHDAYGMDVNGLLLISPVLNFQALAFAPGNDLPYVTFLPTYAAAATYHKKASAELPTDLQTTLKEVEEWALSDYMLALAKGDAISDKERDRIIENLVSYIGLPIDYIKKNNLRIRNRDFLTDLLRTENRTVGLLDSRLTGVELSDGTFADDPSVVATLGAYVATLNDYVRTELKYRNDLPYEYLSVEANQSWNWGPAVQGYPSVMDTLRKVIVTTKYLKIFMAVGYYDLDAPYFATRYNVNHLGLDPSLRDNITLAFYEAGHQMYTDMPSLRKLKADVSAYMERVVSMSLAD
jgi:carboxypeptidase C (cathepsin A)